MDGALDEPAGGFLEVTVRPGVADAPPVAEFVFYDVHGVRLYRAERQAHD
jgi:hypothetical protein